MENNSTEQKPIINCHTHLFTAGHVPPWLAKTFLPWPLFYLLPVSGVVRLFKWWNKVPYSWQFQPWYKSWARRLYLAKEFLARNILLNILYNLVGIFLTLQVIYILYCIPFVAAAVNKFIPDWLSAFIKTHLPGKTWLVNNHLLYPSMGLSTKIILILVLCLFFASGRNFIIFLLKKVWTFLGSLPGKKTRELLKRYLNLGQYAFHDKQETTFLQLQGQYPRGARFVILPMDMEYMGAGKVKIGYRQQMKDLADLKEKYPEVLLPFVFIDPRRIAEEPDYFVYDTGPDGRIRLKDCFIKTFIEEKKFAGFKIYPALGYYPFDAALLPLWKYAAENGLPITTHCIRGTIFYRGAKKKEWDKHPVFQQSKGNQEYDPLLLPEMKNIQFINNFTHPLNYLCLLDKTLLAKVVSTADEGVKAVFGYNEESGEMKFDLHDLKLCFGHYGGDDEWNHYFELDRYAYAAQLDKHPERGIDFNDAEGKPAPGKLEQIWKYVDWYSIISSMMLQYPNVYSDISYIVHSPAILPLLTKSLQPDRGQLRERILYGTDFYVVRNYKSDKNMLADMLAGLTEEEFNLIARENPMTFL